MPKQVKGRRDAAVVATTEIVATLFGPDANNLRLGKLEADRPWRDFGCGWSRECVIDLLLEKIRAAVAADRRARSKR